ncbi:uncharacterized protein LOC125516525 [Triticum urartu]|uniref:uncharacterized protein LOC125516525 n=1 Tax=Triticum urartu TaxID=4572 RepID=UPI002043B68E|nr:uncharacterized protein LOC125516525 [Triticum urartu]
MEPLLFSHQNIYISLASAKAKHRPGNSSSTVFQGSQNMQQPRDAAGTNGGGGFSWVFVPVMFVLLTFNSVMAVYHSRGDAAMVAFVATSYADLLLLFFSLWLYKRATLGSTRRNRLKASVWILTTMLTFAFSYMVMGAAGLTLPVALLVWFIAAATGIGAFSAFFEQGRYEVPS